MKFNYDEYDIINSKTALINYIKKWQKNGVNVHEDRNRYRQCNI